MRASLLALLVLVAAFVLQGATADNRCDPSSADCAGPVREGRVRVAAQQKDSYKEYPRYEEEYHEDSRYGHDYDPKRYQQEAGLEGAKVWGELWFNTQTAEGGPNYFDDEQGYVPEGYGNSHDGGASCAITDYGKEFAYEGHSNLFTVDLDSYGLLSLTDVVKMPGKNNAMVIILRSKAFEGYKITLQSNTFGQQQPSDTPAAVTVLLEGDTITIRVPEITGLKANQVQTAVWKLHVCTTGDCCKNGQYRRHGFLCRPSLGPCDIEEVCSGWDSTCPTDVLQGIGHICKPSTSFCDAPDVCTGTADCPPAVREEGTDCPWAKDGEGCTSTSTLTYSRTGPNPYSKGYKGGEYGKPTSHWPRCVGKCTAAGLCDLSPMAATCCREDEQAYPLEEEEVKYDGDDKDDEDDEEYYGADARARISARITRAPTTADTPAPKPVAHRVRRTYGNKKTGPTHNTKRHGAHGKPDEHHKGDEDYKAKHGDEDYKAKYGDEEHKHKDTSKSYHDQHDRYTKDAKHGSKGSKPEDKHYAGKDHKGDKNYKGDKEPEHDDYFGGKKPSDPKEPEKYDAPDKEPEYDEYEPPTRRGYGREPEYEEPKYYKGDKEPEYKEYEGKGYEGKHSYDGGYEEHSDMPLSCWSG